MRGAQLARQWKILKLLETRKPGLSVAEITQEIDAQPRTIYRGLEALQAAGFPLNAGHEEEKSYWKLLEGFRTIMDPINWTAGKVERPTLEV